MMMIIEICVRERSVYYFTVNLGVIVDKYESVS